MDKRGKEKRKERERETTTTHTQDKTNNAQARVVYVACARNKGLTRAVSSRPFPQLISWKIRSTRFLFLYNSELWNTQRQSMIRCNTAAGWNERVQRQSQKAWSNSTLCALIVIHPWARISAKYQLCAARGDKTLREKRRRNERWMSELGLRGLGMNSLSSIPVCVCVRERERERVKG